MQKKKTKQIRRPEKQPRKEFDYFLVCWGGGGGGDCYR